MAINRVNLEDVISDAKSALEAGNPERAIVLCHHIFNFYPRCLEATRMLGEAYTEQRLFSEAEQLFTFVLSADPQDVLGYVDRGFITYEQGKLDEAILYCERALELDPSIEQLREELLRLYRERQPGVRATIRISKVGLANARLRDGLYGQAIDEFNTVLRQTPSRLDVQVGLMEAYWRNRDFNRAEQIATDLIQHNSFLVKANLILWHIYGVRRNQENASDYLERAHALDPLNLLAERLFEDSPGATEALNYISMLGVPSIPAPDFEALRAAIAKQPMVPDWAAGGSATDVVLGLKSDRPSVADAAPATSASPNMGLDLFNLLSDTEKHVAEESGQAADLYPETEEGAEEPVQAAPAQAATPPDETAATTTDDHEAFKLYEEVAAPEDAGFVPTVKPAPAPEPDQNTAGSFDLDFSIAKEGDLSLFEEIEQRMQPVESEDLTPLAPFSFEPDITSDSEFSSRPSQSSVVSSDLAPFTFDEDVSPPEFMRDIPPFFADNEPASPFTPASLLDGAAISATPQIAKQEDFALPTLEPFSFDENAEPAKEEDFEDPMSRTSSFQFQDFYASDDEPDELTQAFRFTPEFSRQIGTDDLTPKNLTPETFQQFEPEEVPGLPVESEPEPHPTSIPTPSMDQPEGHPDAHPALEPFSLPETEPGAEPDQPLPMYETEAASAAEPVNRVFAEAEDSEGGAFAREVVAPTSFVNPADELVEVYREPHAFYKRDEQGPVPDFALAQIEQEASLPPFSGLEDLDSSPATEASAPASPTTLQENSQMPIRRGQENLNDLFDWEREELPDYLQPFALDEEEFTQSDDLGPESPFIADVNTPPARIRSREDTGPISFGDLPAWLVNDPATEAVAPPPAPEPVAPVQSTEQAALDPVEPTAVQPVAEDTAATINRMEIGTNALPAWLSQPSPSITPPANSPAFDDSDFGDLAPFNLEDNNDFNAPFSPSQPAANFNSGGFAQEVDLEPFRLDDDTNDFTPPVAPPVAPVAAYPAELTPPLPLPDLTGEVHRAPGEAAPPPAPVADFDLGLDLDDLKPFSFEEFDAAMPAPPSNQAAPPTSALITPPPAAQPVAPAAFAADEDFDDLLPFNLEDDGTQTVPPPAAAPVPALEPVQVPFADQVRHTEPLSGDLSDMRPFSLADFNELPESLPDQVAPSAAPGGQPDFDFEPFTWNENGKLFGEADTATFNPFENQSGSQFNSLSQNDYAQPAPPPASSPVDSSEDRPLRQFEWSRPRQPEESSPANKVPSLFDRLVARRKETEANSTHPLTEPAAARPAPTGPAEITDEDLLPIEELEARAARRDAANATQPLTPPEVSPVQQLDAAVATGTTPATVEPAIEDAPPVQAYAEAPDVPALPVQAGAAPIPEVVPASAQEVTPTVAATATPAPVQPVEKAVQLYEQQDINQSLNYFNQAVRTAGKDDLSNIVSKLKEITGAADANPRFHRVLGDAYKKQGQFQAALAEYSKALAGSGTKK